MFAGYKFYTVLEKKASCKLAKLACDNLFREYSKAQIPFQILKTVNFISDFQNNTRKLQWLKYQSKSPTFICACITNLSQLKDRCIPQRTNPIPVRR
jgi:hypothetical protein